jgi:hypothetical protein
LVWTHLSAATLLVASPLVHADNSNPKAPPGYKTVYVEAGGKKIPMLVKQQLDPLRNVNNPEDPLDHQKVYSETNFMADKTFLSPAGTGWNKSA